MLADPLDNSDLLDHHVGDMIFDRVEFTKWKNVTGRDFSVDSSCLKEFHNAQLHDPNYSPLRKSFLKIPCEGQHVWLDPPHNKIFVMINHYLECKAKAPQTTSACIVVPRWVGGSPWRKLLKGMRLLHEYAPNTPLYFECVQDKSLVPRIGEPYPVQIWYDPPMSPNSEANLPGVLVEPWAPQDDGPRVRKKKTLSAIGTGQDYAYKYAATLNGTPIEVYLDSCSLGANWITKGVAQSCLAEFRAIKPTVVSLANDKEVLCTQVCMPRLHMQMHVSSPVCHVIDQLPGGVGLILGTPWLEEFQVDLKHRPDGKGHATFMKSGRRCKLAPVAADDTQCPAQLNPQSCWPELNKSDCSASVSPLLLSAMQFKRQLKHANRAFVVHVAKVEESGQSREEKKPPEIPADLQPVIDKYKHVFDPLPLGLPPERPVGHIIPLVPDARPPRRAMYRLSPKEKEEVERQVKDLLDRGWIRPSKSPYASPILFVQKKDSTLRMCIDYRALNKITVKDRYPLPRIDDLLDQLHGATRFSSIDLASGYNQIRVHPDDVEKTAFITHQGLYEYLVASFGLCNMPSVFQRTMNHVLGPAIGKYALVYMDDILIFSKDEASHAQHLEEVLKLLSDNHFYAKMSKCTFGKSELAFLGCVVSASGIQVDPKKISALQEWPRPTNVEQVRSFLGLATYFRKFVQNFSTIAHPLHALTRKSVAFVWDSRCHAAFNELKQRLTSAPVLATPDFSADAPIFEVICDASQVAVGAILLQGGRPIAYESRTLGKSEKNYHPGELELLSVVHAMRTWRPYLEGVKSRVITDHNPLIYLNTQPNLTRRQARWSEYLQNFDFEWKYRPGKGNPADSLSRLPAIPSMQLACMLLLPLRLQRQRAMPARYRDAYEPPVKKRQPSTAKTAGGTSKGKKKQPAKPRVNPDAGERCMPRLLDRCRDGYKSDPWFQDDTNTASLRFLNGLYQNEKDIIYVPDVDTLRVEILSEIHDTPFGGHLGASRTLEQVSRLFTWPQLFDDVKEYVRTCHGCQSNKAVHTGQKGLLQPLDIPGRRWESVGLDFIIALPKTAEGNTQILVYIDRLTKMVHLRALKEDATAKDVARSFIHDVFRLHGLPSGLISDRDSKFTSAFWRECLRVLGTSRNMSTAFRPQTDGQTERTNKVLEDMLRHWVNATQDNWDDLLDCAEFAINNAYNKSTGSTPFRLNYGQDPLTPLSIEAETKIPAVEDFVHEMKESLIKAKQSLLAAQSRMKAHYDAHRTAQIFNVGDEVMLNSINLKFKGHPTRKLLPKWIGPFKVLKRVGELAYQLELPECLKVHDVFHTSLLKPYHKGGRYQPPPLPLQVDGELYFDVEAILEMRANKRGNKREFLVKWLGYGPECNSWEPESNLASAREILDAFLQSQESVKRD